VNGVGRCVPGKVLLSGMERCPCQCKVATTKDLLVAYPHLTSDDIQAAITYAADSRAHEEILLEPKA
jgi:L-lysine 2,3-aminomutase